MLSSSRAAEILSALREAGPAPRIQGAVPAAVAHVLLECAAELRGTWVVLCPDEEHAETLQSDLSTLGGESTCRSRTYLFGDHSPYGAVAPSLRARLGRLGTLAALTEPDPRPLIICTTPLAASLSIIPKKPYERLSTAISRGPYEGGRDALVLRLGEAGYLRVEPVEDAGTFAVRGDIVDVFPVGHGHPFRIEFFDDEVERIRGFDPASQRAKFELGGSCLIKPAREMILTSETSPRIREQVKAFADDRGISRAIRDPLLTAVAEGRYPENSETWAPFAYETPGTLLTHGSPSLRVVWWDSTETLRVADERLRALGEEEPEAQAAGRILPPARRLFQWDQKSESALNSLTALHFDRVRMLGSDESLGSAAPPKLEGGAGPRVHLSLSLKENSDLLRAATPEERLSRIESLFETWKNEAYRIVAVAGSRSAGDRLQRLLASRELAHSLRIGPLTGGFRWPAEKLAIVTEGELTGGRRRRGAARAAEDADLLDGNREWNALRNLSEIAPGDLVVHVEQGIGRYGGMARFGGAGEEVDFLLIEYADNDRLYIPVYRLNAVQKYQGGQADTPLDRLGGKRFEREKARLRESVRHLAIDLVDLYARRGLQAAPRLDPHPEELADFESKFPYDETTDQLKAIQDVYADLASGRLMDRLICGDVGFGKTEVALRAAFAAVASGKQVAVLVPTTVLCLQHEASFKDRFRDYPYAVASVSAFKTKKEQTLALEGAATGKVDILVGTHRLLSRDVAFKALGLVVVDEEHRFGVEHKEKLKALKLSSHVLTMTATPIPRTLHMALSGMRDISLITTPPVDRLAIRTYVSRADDQLIRKAVLFEVGRGGQVYIVHNRVQSIREFARRVQEIVPGIRIAVGHGQMAEGELERVMVGFYRKEADVLVCTTIIESGLDVPSANTILIDRADTLGLAQLYQLRGRVGRSDQRAYAYLMVPESGRMTEDARRRLEVIQKFVELGAGFSIASHDLEIRGGGNLLGPEQSGHIAAVGFELYTELLEEAIRDLRGQPLRLEEIHREPEIKTPFAAFLPESFIPDAHQRLTVYRRLSACRTDAEVDQMEDELRDRFGRPSEPAENLLWIIRIKIVLKAYGVDGLTAGPQRLTLVPGKATRINPATVVSRISSEGSDIQLTPDSRLVMSWDGGTLRDLLFRIESALDRLAASC
ncbi:MAG: transcription-repair coupling factor [Bdellovibrionales bacterium]|nr:transcription-repair coupling factor [Bdellovibrionales bacterium]